jgi:hypothetical protein
MHGNHPPSPPAGKTAGGRRSTHHQPPRAKQPADRHQNPHPQFARGHALWSTVRPSMPDRRQLPPRQLTLGNWMGWTTWWLSRGARTRSHPELGRENPQRPWYCVLRHGRVGRRQVFQPIQNSQPTKRLATKSRGNRPSLQPGKHPARQATNRRPENRPKNKPRHLQPRGGAAR